MIFRGEIVESELDGLILFRILGEVIQGRRVVDCAHRHVEARLHRLAGVGHAGDALVGGLNGQRGAARRVGLVIERQRRQSLVDRHRVEEVRIGIALHLEDELLGIIFLVVEGVGQLDNGVGCVFGHVDVVDAARRRRVIERIDLHVEGRLRAEAAAVGGPDGDVGLAIGVAGEVEHQVGQADIDRRE